jgi:IS30 family transposase
MKKPNGLIRQCVPMGKGADELSDENVAEIIDRIKIRSREWLGFKIPKQLFSQLHQPVWPASRNSVRQTFY